MKKTTKIKIHEYYPDNKDVIDDIIASLWREGIHVRVHSKPWLGRKLKTSTLHIRVKGGRKVRKRVKQLFAEDGIKVKTSWSLY